MAKEFGLTDEQVEQEIERLRQSPKGAALMKAGIDMDVLNALAEMGDYDDPC